MSTQTKRHQDDADDRDDQTDDEPHSVTGHETSRDQVHSLPGEDSADDHSDHTNNDEGDTPEATVHADQLTLRSLCSHQLLLSIRGRSGAGHGFTTMSAMTPTTGA